MGGKGAPRQLTFVINTAESDLRGFKSVVNTHVAKVAHQRRRDAKANRSELAARAINRGAKWEICKRCGCARGGNEHEHCTCISRQALRQANTRPAPFSAKVCFNQGNSDPFAATPIVVDVTINDLLTFCRDFLLPCLHGKEVDSGQLHTPVGSGRILSAPYKTSAVDMHICHDTRQ